jgi:hypothetical protein
MNNGMITMVVDFPSVWPVKVDNILYQNKLKDLDVTLKCLSDGSLSVTLNHLIFNSQRIKFLNAHRGLITLLWDLSLGEIKLMINDVYIQSAICIDYFKVYSLFPVVEDINSINHQESISACRKWIEWRASKFNSNKVKAENERILVTIDKQFNQLEVSINNLKKFIIEYNEEPVYLIYNALPILRALLYWREGRKTYNPLLLRLAAFANTPLPVYVIKDRIKEINEDELFKDISRADTMNFPTTVNKFESEELIDFQEWLDMEAIVDKVDYNTKVFKWKEIIALSANTSSFSHFDDSIPFIVDRLSNSIMWDRSQLFNYVVNISKVTIDLSNYVLSARPS